MKISKCDFCKYRWECKSKDKNDCKLEKENKEKKQNERPNHKSR